MIEPLFTLTLPVDRSTAWSHLRDPALIALWHGWESDDLAEEIDIIYEQGAEVVEDGSVLHLGGHLLRLDERGDDTLVTLTRAVPLASSAALDWEAMYDDIDEGWRSFLEQLRFALTHHPGEPRRTVHLSGAARSDPPVHPLDALGVRGVEDLSEGAPFEAITRFEEGISGTVWHRTPLQLGLVVDNWGPGLLLLAEAPGADPPGSAVALTITTYGVSDVRSLAERWAAWWDEHYRS